MLADMVQHMTELQQYWDYYLYYNLILANCRSQFLLDCFGICIKLFVSTESVFLSRVLVSVRPSIFIRENIQKLSRRPALAQLSVEWTSSDPSKRVKPIMVDRSPATTWAATTTIIAATTAIIAATDWATTVTTRVITFTAWKMWFTNYCVAYAFV